MHLAFLEDSGVRKWILGPSEGNVQGRIPILAVCVTWGQLNNVSSLVWKEDVGYWDLKEERETD